MACLHMKSFEIFLSGLEDNNLSDFVFQAQGKNELASRISNIAIAPEAEINLQNDLRQAPDEHEDGFDFFKHFLLQSFLNSPHMTDYVHSVDLRPLSYLENILVKRGVQAEDESSRMLMIEFHFKQNPFFKNEILTLDVKANFVMEDNESFEIPSFPHFEFVKGSNIEFFEGTDFRQVMDAKRLKRSDYHQIVVIRKQSFFDVFQMFDDEISDPTDTLKQRTSVFNCFVKDLLVKFLPNILYYALPQKEPEDDVDFPNEGDLGSNHSRSFSESHSDRHDEKETSFTNEDDYESAD